MSAPAALIRRLVGNPARVTDVMSAGGVVQSRRFTRPWPTSAVANCVSMLRERRHLFRDIHRRNHLAATGPFEHRDLLRRNLVQLIFSNGTLGLSSIISNVIHHVCTGNTDVTAFPLHCLPTAWLASIDPVTYCPPRSVVYRSAQEAHKLLGGLIKHKKSRATFSVVHYPCPRDSVWSVERGPQH